MLREKILSILSHITNSHKFEENLKHKECSHPELCPAEERTKPFIQPDSDSAKKLERALRGNNDSRFFKS